MAESGAEYVLRRFTPEDYEEYASWWGEEVPPSGKNLPLIGLVSGDMKAVGFLARTDTDFAIITWWYANPDNKGRESYMALLKIFKGLCEAASIAGKRNVFLYTQKRGIIRILESMGFINYNGHLVLGVSNG